MLSGQERGAEGQGIQPVTARPSRRLWAILGCLALAHILLDLAEYGELRFLSVTGSVFEAHGVLAALLYFVVHVLAVAGTIVLLGSRSRFLRIASAITLLACVGAHRMVLALMSERVAIEHVRIAVEEAAMAGSFVTTYSGSILRATAVAALVVVVMWLAAAGLRPRFGRRAVWVPLLALLGVTSFTAWTANEFSSFPSLFRLPAGGLLAIGHDSLYEGPRDELPAETVARSGADRHIVLVVDESIRGDFLSINGYSQKTTPWLETQVERTDFCNLGVACSAGNTSNKSNLVLMTGLPVDECPDRKQRSLRVPTLFRYAKRAGYKTAYLDAQAPAGAYVNYMRAADASDIDIFYRVSDARSDIELHARDSLLLERALQLLRQERGQRLFVVLLKAGAHYPYESFYPETARHFQPVMGAYESMSSAGVAEIENSYANVVRWSVDEFFEAPSRRLRRRKRLRAVHERPRPIDQRARRRRSRQDREPAAESGDGADDRVGQARRRLATARRALAGPDESLRCLRDARRANGIRSASGSRSADAAARGSSPLLRER